MQVYEGIQVIEGIKISDGIEVNNGVLANIQSGVAILPPVPSPYCPWMTYIPVSNNWDSINQNSINQTITLNSDSATFKFAQLVSDQSWNTNDGEVSFENTIVTIEEPSVFDLSMGIADLLQGEIICGAYPTSAGGGDLIDIDSGVPIGSIVMANGYKYGFTFDANTVSGSLYDNQANVGVMTINSLYNPINDLNLVISSATSDIQTIVMSPNPGSRAFDFSESTGDGYCAISPPPPPELCAPATLFINQAPSPNDQTMELSGDNSLTVDSTSLGNSGIQSAYFDSGTDFQTLTEEVKYEVLLKADTTTDASGNWQMYMMTDLYTTPLLACGISIRKNSSTVVDVLTGMPIASTQTFTPNVYKAALYLDATGSARMRDTNLNNTPITLNGSYDNTKSYTMLVLPNAGTNVGEVISLENNYGSSAFDWEDAERHCNL